MRKPSRKPRAWCLVATLCTLVLASACSGEPHPPVRIGTNVWPGYEPLYLARALGLLDERQTRLVEYSNATDVLRAFRGQAIEIAAVTIDEALLLAADGTDPVVLLVADQSTGGDALMASAAIGSMAELRGRKVGVETSALGAYFLTRALQSAGLRVADVEVVDVTAEEHALALESGRVDAVATFEPARSALLARGAHVLFDSRQIPGEIVDVLVARRTWVTAHLAEVRALRGHWFAALEELRANPRAAIDVMRAREGISAEQLTRALDGLVLPDEAGNRALLAGPSPPLLATAERVGAFLVEQGLANPALDVRRMIDIPAGVLEAP